MVMRIKELRRSSNMTQHELAEKMGVIRSAVANWETENCLPRVRQLPQLAEVFDCAIGELFAQSDSASA